MKPLPNQNSPLSDLEPFAQIAHIVTDLDGTLTKGFDPIWKRIKTAISYFKQQGVTFTIATGRSLNGAKPVLDELQLRIGMPVILSNGTVVVGNRTSEVIKAESISKRAKISIQKIVAQYSLSAYASRFLADIYIESVGSISPECEFVYGWGVECKDLDFNGLPIHWNAPDDGVLPTTVVLEIHDKNKVSEIFRDLNKIEDIDITTSGTGYIEIAPLNCNKGTALELACQRYGWKKESVLCIGDNDNDIPLLQAAGIGIVVSNSSKMAQNMADYISAEPNMQGVLDVCDIIKDAKRFYKQ